MPNTLNDFLSPVLLNLGNRSDISTRIQQWLQDAYVDLCMTVPFEELRVSKPDSFTTADDTYPYPNDCRAIVTINHTDSTRVKRKNIQIARRYSTTTTGKPSIYAPFGRQIIVRPIPGQDYPFIWDYWQMPQLDAAILPTVVLTPLDWNEIIIISATMRGHIALMERDKASELRQLLYGDPTDPSEPGLIKRKILIHAAENIDSDFEIRPRGRNYTSRR